VSAPFLRIGPFSRASSLSIKALRAYHDQGLLVPAEIDSMTGYRAYSADQLLDAAVLRRLRDLDVPLRRIREVLEARDPSVTARVLAEHTQAMQQRLDDTVRIIGQLQRGLDEPSLHTPVHVRDEPARHALMLEGRVDEATVGPFLDDAFRVLLAMVDRLGAQATGVPGGLYPQEIADDGEDVAAYIPIIEPVEVPAHVGVRLGELPATTVAVAVHLGSYDDIAETYRHLGRWVAVNATPRPLSVRERYLVGPPEPEDEYCTEIHWPVESSTTATDQPTAISKEH
jgi:DNA-binding transcriptional MerR regulator